MTNRDDDNVTSGQSLNNGARGYFAMAAGCGLLSLYFGIAAYGAAHGDNFTFYDAISYAGLVGGYAYGAKRCYNHARVIKVKNAEALRLRS